MTPLTAPPERIRGPMRRILPALILFACTTVTGIAQMGRECNLTNDTCVSDAPFFFQNGIVVTGHDVRVVYVDGTGAQRDIYYRRSRNDGGSWDPPIRLTNVPRGTDCPSLAVYDGVVHIVYHSHEFAVPPDTTGEIMYLRSLDGGDTWEAPVRLTDNAYESGVPVVAAEGEDVHVSWTEQPGKYEVRYRHSYDRGANWETDWCLSPANSYEHGASSIAISDNAVHIVWWQISSVAMLNKCLHRRYLKSTATWEDVQVVNSMSGRARNPSVAAYGNNVHVVWTDPVSGVDQIYTAHSSNDGESWSQSTPVSVLPGPEWMTRQWYHQELATIACTNRTVEVIWKENRDLAGSLHTWELYHSRSHDHGVTWPDTMRMTMAGTYTSMHYSIAAVDSDTDPDNVSLHMIWTDHRGGDLNGEIYYSRTDVMVGAGHPPSPERMTLSSYPNPGSNRVTLAYTLADAARVTLTLTDMLGRVVMTRELGVMSAGPHAHPLDVRHLANGSYHYRLDIGGDRASGVILVTK